MRNLSEITKIIEGGLQRDPVKAINYSQRLIEKLEKQGDNKTASKLTSLIKNTNSIEMKAMNNQISKSNPPVDQESRLPLAEIQYPDKENSYLFVNKWLESFIDEYIELINSADDLVKEDVEMYRNMLLYGPPGTGKSQTAKYIGAQTNLPLVIVRIDSLVSSYLGHTAKNIRALFEYVKKNPCIMFLDEFDAIAKMRDDEHELGEIKRVVNALLQNIDSIRGQIPVIAATNHHHLLDEAVWRRFDYKLEYDLPDEENRQLLLEKYFESISISDHIIRIMTALTDGMNGAEMKILSESIKTHYVLKKIDEIDERNLFKLYYRFISTGENYNPDSRFNDEKTRIAKSLREKNKNLFSIKILSKMLNCSTGKVSTMLREGIEENNGK